ncbi:M23 family metallopeptidase [Hymenobacter persicinus]|uniref:M23 family metallopeptidase n=1 Tax=Hymenobacter persicinus TaxID=2025506 RepID=UPI0013EBB265|nr:M23 family metallopeptidase [Hymenobacter persicinus]
MPYTVYLRADLRHVTSSVPLPARIVVFPGKKPQLLTTFTPEPDQPFYFRYYAPNQLGIYTGQLPDTAYVYRLPYQSAVPAEPPHIITRKGNGPEPWYPYFFPLPGGTALCAAREGIVATLRQDARRNRGSDGNFVIIIHEDGSYAWYQNLRQQSATVRIGQRVAQGDVIGYSCANDDNPVLYFTVNYPGATAEKIETAPVVFGNGTQLLRPR